MKKKTALQDDEIRLRKAVKILFNYMLDEDLFDVAGDSNEGEFNLRDSFMIFNPKQIPQNLNLSSPQQMMDNRGTS